jgi:PAS domain S-box-containing protein
VIRTATLTREIKHNEKRWRSLLENVELAVLGCELDGRINFVNPFFLRVTGMPKPSVMGARVEELVVPEEVPSLLEKLRVAIQQGPDPRSEWSFKCASGDSRRFLWSTVPLLDSNNAMVGFLSVGEDITDRIRAEETARNLSGRIMSAQEDERSRLARELHDDVTQRLARLAIDAGRTEKNLTSESDLKAVRSIRENLVRLSEDVHSLAYRLHPSVLEDLGLVEALRVECDRFTRWGVIPARLKIQSASEAVPRPVALCLFRIAQEALRNVARHARASSVEVSLLDRDRGIQLAVKDDGAGFDPKSPRDHPSLGHASMRERVNLLGGELDIESSPGYGTTILAWVPLTGTGK